MASIFGDDGVDDLFNNQLPLEENQELPSGDEDGAGNARENLFGDAADVEGGAAGEDGEADGKPEKVEPKKRGVRNPRPRLTVETLRGQRGIHTIEQYYTDIKFKGKGHEGHDLDEVMRRLQHWGHRMYPNYKFDDVLSNIDRLGKKKPLQVHMSRYRLGLLQDIPTGGDELAGDDDEAGGSANTADEPFDEFDALLGEQIAISKLAPRTPAQTPHNRYSGGANSSAMSTSTFATPSFSRGQAVMSTPYSTVYGSGAGGVDANLDESDLATPLPASQPEMPAPSASTKSKLSSEQMARIAENRRKALEIRAKRLEEQQQKQNLETAAAQV